MTLPTEGFHNQDKLFESEADYGDIQYIRPAAVIGHIISVLQARGQQLFEASTDGTFAAIKEEAVRAQRIIS